jgi:hypothetical protein
MDPTDEDDQVEDVEEDDEAVVALSSSASERLSSILFPAAAKRGRRAHDRCCEVGDVLSAESDVWKHFRRIAGGAQCVHCKRAFDFDIHQSWPTGNARKHLQGIIHHEHLHTPLLPRPVTAGAAPRSAAVLFRSAVEKQERRQQHVDRYKLGLYQLIAENGLSMRIVETESFRSFIGIAWPEAPVMTRASVRAGVLVAADAVRRDVATKLKCSDAVSLAIDLWTGRDCVSYLGVVAHCISTDWTSTILPVGLVPMSADSSGPAVAQAVVSLFRRLDSHVRGDPGSPSLLDKVQYITTDGGSNMKTAVHALGKQQVSCAAHLIQLALRDFCCSDPDLVALLGSARHIAGSLNRSSAARREVGRLRTMVSTRFDTAFLCLRTLLRKVDQLKQFKPKNPSVQSALQEFLCKKHVGEAALIAMDEIAGLSDDLSRHGDSTIAFVLPALSSAMEIIRNCARNESEMARDYMNRFVDALRARTAGLYSSELHIAAYYFSPLSARASGDVLYLSLARDHPSSRWPWFLETYMHGAITSYVKRSSILRLENLGSKESAWSSRPEWPSDTVLPWFKSVGGMDRSSPYFACVHDAKPILVAMATEVDVERMFSHAGAILSDRRTSMLPATLEAMLLLRMRF